MSRLERIFWVVLGFLFFIASTVIMRLMYLAIKSVETVPERTPLILIMIVFIVLSISYSLYMIFLGLNQKIKWNYNFCILIAKRIIQYFVVLLRILKETVLWVSSEIKTLKSKKNSKKR